MVFVDAVLNGKFAAILSASEIQGLELYRSFRKMWEEERGGFGMPDGEVKVTQAEFSNGGRILIRPASEKSSRGFHAVSLLVLDEGAQIPDELFGAVTPSISMVNGRIVAMSTPFGKRGWFWEQWNQTINHPIKNPPFKWVPAFIPWTKCPRIRPEVVETYRMFRGELGVRQEYSLEFLDVQAGSPFDLSRWDSMGDAGLEML